MKLTTTNSVEAVNTNGDDPVLIIKVHKTIAEKESAEDTLNNSMEQNRDYNNWLVFLAHDSSDSEGCGSVTVKGFQIHGLKEIIQLREILNRYFPGDGALKEAPRNISV